MTTVRRWTGREAKLLREALRLSVRDFAARLGIGLRTVNKWEARQSDITPLPYMQEVLDTALARASDEAKARFSAAVHAPTANHEITPPPVRGARLPVVVASHPARTLDDLRSAVLDTTVGSDRCGVLIGRSSVAVMTATVQTHLLYQLTDYDAAAQLLPAVLTCLHNRVETGSNECLVGTLTARHATAAAYIAAAKLATKLGDVGLASVTADRSMTAAKESEHPELIGATTYQVACAFLLAGELAAAEQILTVGAETVAATPRLNCRQEEALSVQGSLLLLLAIVAAKRGDRDTAQHVLREASRLAEQLGCDGNWLWTAFGPTNVAIHRLSVQSRLGNAKEAARVAESIDTDALPAELRGRRSQVHLELGWVAAGQDDDALAVLHLLEAERIAEKAVSCNASARTLLSVLLAREHRSVTPGLRGLASRAGLLL
ncbi:MAG: transcriptional regulator [Actinomycetota bacterium]|nr:transcriptional regulator [Actinomycetota bacterium]